MEIAAGDDVFAKDQGIVGDTVQGSAQHLTGMA
jgi:hypothetical protein